jgi:uncharacterized membrane protein YdcZ (DUF606 family)
VAAHQGWQFFNVVRNRWLAHAHDNGRLHKFDRRPKSQPVLDAVWPSTWRSGVGIFLSYGLVQASGIFYAQVGSTAGVASYLLALRLITAVSQFSQAPFYSKIPQLARLFAEDKQGELLEIAKRGMFLSHWSYLLGFLGLGLLGGPILNCIGSNAEFPSSHLWILMGLGFFAERYGAMHIQLYSSTNHIIWHIANGVTGTIYLVFSLLLFPHLGVYAFPIAMLLGYLGFYSWYAALHSYRYFQLRFMPFESRVSLPQICVILLYAIVSMCVW